MRPYDESEIVLYLADNRGVYIPRDFAIETKRDCVEGVSAEDWATLEAGPSAENEWYWETWADVEDKAILTDPSTGTRYRIVQNGDAWLVPEDMELPEDFFS